MFIRSLVYLFALRCKKKKKLHLVFVGIHELACENIRFFSLFVTGGEERGDTDVFAGYTGAGDSASFSEEIPNFTYQF